LLTNFFFVVKEVTEVIASLVLRTEVKPLLFSLHQPPIIWLHFFNFSNFSNF